MDKFDVIVIGAGNGGLTAAASLAQKGVKVLVLERHNIPGGCATSFCRGRFEFEVALHQLSGMGPPEKPGPLRSTLERLGVMEKLEFMPMKDIYRLVIPETVDITLKPNREAFVGELTEYFPHEKDGIREYVDLIYGVFTEVISVFYLDDPEASPEKYPLYFKYALKSTQEVMDQFFKDPLLQTVISPYWSYIGLPPRKMAFVDMAAMLFAFLEFAPYHLKGGSQAISNALADTIIERGGTIRFNCGVKKIIVEESGVQGVITDQGETIQTNYIISNASKITTYVDMIDQEQVPEEVFGELKQCSLSQSAFTLYMGLDCEPAAVGITESTNFLMTGVDMDQSHEQMRSIEIGEQDAMLLSCYNLVDPGFSPPGTSQIALVTLKYGDAWLRVPPAQYASEKYRIAEDMLRLAEKTFPGLQSHIEEIEIATPITHLRYLSHPRGSIYGFESFIKDSNVFIPNQPHIKGLYHAGASVGLAGFQPTLDSGVITAKTLYRELTA